MTSRSKVSEFLGNLGLGAVVGVGGAGLFGIVEAMTNTAAGLYQPLGLWAFAVGVYAFLGLLGGLGLGLLTFVWRNISFLPRVVVGPFLAATYLGALIFVFIGLPLNDRALPDLISVQGLLGNAIFASGVAGLTLLFYFALRSRRGPAWGLGFVNLGWWLSVLLAVGDHIDTFVGPLSFGSLTPFVVLLAICVAGYWLGQWALRGLDLGTHKPLAPITVLVALALIVLGLTFGLHRKGGGATGPVPVGKPNVLWLVMDTTRADHMSGYGYDRPTSPAVDAIAAGGATFEEAHAESSWTIPGHFVMVTGRFDAAREKLLSEEFSTAAEIFTDQGYETAAVLGNMSLGRGSGFEQGFDEFVDGPVRIFYLSAFEKLPVLKVLMSLGVAPPEAILRSLHRKTFLQNEAVRAEAMNEYALDWLEQRDTERPFFLFINYMDPHDAYDPPDKYREKFAAQVDPTHGFVRYSRKHGGTLSSNAFVRDVGSEYGDQEWDEMLDLYDAEIAYVDEEIEELDAWLEENGLADDTLVIITSDHGELFGEHGLANHFKALTREETHVPLVVRLPGRIEPGTRIKKPVQLRDILPTVLDLLEIEERPEMDGRSLAPLLDGREADSSEGTTVGFLYRPVDKEYWFTAPGHLLSHRTADTQYVWSSTGMHEFYDLLADPDADQNLHDSHPDEPVAVESFEVWREADGFDDFGGKQKKVNRLMQDKLKALGYVN